MVILSLIGAFTAMLIPQKWLGLLRVVPLFMGIKTAISNWRISKDSTDDEVPAASEARKNKILGGIISVYTLKVASV
ncbi:hypothetical protein YDYSG_42480 [Paenibacillus tyrfis]|nr:hypothetical protein YDYSG_42480 [Paenibacillus tyrfis]